MTTRFHHAGLDERELVRTARTAGLSYLGLCVTGLLGHILLRGQIFDPADPAATLSHLADREMLARLGMRIDGGAAPAGAVGGR